MNATEFEAIKVAQKIINNYPSVSQIEGVLSKETAEMRAAVVDYFHGDQNFRRLFPEYAVIFDENDFK